MKKKAEKKPKPRNFCVVLRTEDNLIACGHLFEEQKEAEELAKDAVITHKAVWDVKLSANVPVRLAYVCKIVSEASATARVEKVKS